MVSYALQEELDEEDNKEEEKTTSNLDIFKLLDEDNIVDEIPDDQVPKILELYDEAKSSMKKWLKSYDRAIKLAKMQPKEEHKTFPFKGASTAMAPFVLEACIDFNARSAPELAYTDNIVKAKVYGGTSLPDVPPPPPPPQRGPEAQQQGQQIDAQMQQAYEQKVAAREEAQERIDTEKEDRASRVAEYSNYQLSELIPTWKRSQDKLLMSLPCVGTMYKETYFDSETQEVCSDLCYGDEIIFNQDYPTFEDAPDYFKSLPQMTKNEVIEKIRGEDEWAIDEDDLSDDDKETYDFINAYTWVDVDKDGLKEPYLVIIWRDKEKAVYARPLFDEDTVTEDDGVITKVRAIAIFTQYQFLPDPEGSPMGLGWGIILGPAFEQINTSIRQMSDAGTLQVLASNSGIIADRSGTNSRGNRAKRGPIEVSMGKLTPIQMGGTGSLAQDIVQFPAAGPSPALFQLLEYMVESARRLTDASSQVETHPSEAAALYLARLQQTLKRPNSIIMRVYNAASKEFKKIFELNFKHHSDEKYNRVIDDEVERNMRNDFNPDDCDIVLVSDPSQGSDIERLARAEAVLQNAKTEQTPLTDMREATKNYYKAIGVADVDLLVPEPQGPDPMQAMMQQQMEMEAAEKAMDAEFRQREQKLREQDQQLKQAELQMKGAKQQLEGFKEMKSMGLETDLKEADITLKYSQAMKNLSEVTASFAELKAIEDQFINQIEGDLSNDSRAVTATPAVNPGTSPVMGV